MAKEHYVQPSRKYRPVEQNKPPEKTTDSLEREVENTVKEKGVFFLFVCW